MYDLQRRKPRIFHLDEVLYNFYPAKPGSKPSEKNDWTLRDAVRGVQIFGGIGSGKSSGSGYALAMTYLKNGFGGLVLTGKVDETPVWLDYARKAGRLEDVVIFGPYTDQYFEKYPELRRRHSSEFRFDPLEYERTREGRGAGETRNIVDLFSSLAKMGGRATGEVDDKNSGFWERAMRRCIQAAVNLLILAGKPVTVNQIAYVIRHTPLTGNPLERFDNAKETEWYAWGQKSKTIAYIAEALKNVAHSGDPSQAQTFDVVKHYFLLEFQALAPETRSSILEHFYSLADPFRTGLLAKYFSGSTDDPVMPERTFEGKIIILDFPVKEYLEVGVYAQAIYKKLWQQAAERRAVDQYSRPVFLWVDEAQYFINHEDVMFQTTARSARACTVLISQNISNYYANISGAKSKELVNSLLGNLATKIFHNNSDYVTNEWAANSIGKAYREKETATDDDRISWTSEYQYQYLPRKFLFQRTGGPLNHNIVDGVVMVAGKKFSNGKNYLVAKFSQEPEQ